MAKKPPPPDDGPVGAPKWMVTFSDCMTLLLTFFVLLLSFSSFDDKKFRKMTTSLANALPSIASQKQKNDAMLNHTPVRYQPDRDRGSEKPDDGDTAGNLNEGRDYLDFEQRKVYLVRSDTMFLGMGAELSLEGKELLTDLATVVREMAHRMVVSEHPRPAGTGSDPLGMRRAWSVVRFLTEHEEISQARFAIAGSPTVPLDNAPPNSEQLQYSRLLEISLLEMSVSE